VSAIRYGKPIITSPTKHVGIHRKTQNPDVHQSGSSSGLDDSPDIFRLLNWHLQLWNYGSTDVLYAILGVQLDQLLLPCFLHIPNAFQNDLVHQSNRIHNTKLDRYLWKQSHYLLHYDGSSPSFLSLRYIPYFPSL